MRYYLSDESFAWGLTGETDVRSLCSLRYNCVTTSLPCVDWYRRGQPAEPTGKQDTPASSPKPKQVRAFTVSRAKVVLVLEFVLPLSTRKLVVCLRVFDCVRDLYGARVRNLQRS